MRWIRKLRRAVHGYPGVVLGAAVLLNGCTTELAVVPIAKTANDPIVGWSYSLPLARYDVLITRRLVNCDPVKVDTKISAQQLLERDSAHTYAIDHETLSNGWKTSELSIELHSNGMLKSVNAEAKDATSQIVSDVATGVTSLVSTLAATRLSTKRLERAGASCRSDVRQLINDRRALAADVRGKTQELGDAVATLNAWNAGSVATGNKLDPSMQREFIAVAAGVSAKQKALERATAALERNTAKLTVVHRVRWPATSDQPSWYEIPGGVDSEQQWFTGKSSIGALRLVLTPSDSHKDPGSKTREPTASDGIRYRVPVKGRLLICEIDKGNDDSGCPSKSNVVVEGPVPQLGRLHVLPYRNGPFQSNVMKATFAADGNLITASYADRESKFAKAADRFSNLVELVTKTAEDVDHRRKGKIKAETEGIEAETALLQAKADLQKAKLAAFPLPNEEQRRQTALLQADTELIKAKQAKIEAELALEAARKNAAE